MGRYRASGLSVARFCRKEDVSVHTFYYWTKRLRMDLAPSPSRAMSTPGTVGAPGGGVVRFRWDAGWEVAVPAECLGAIRCLAECLTGAGGRRGEAFQEVVVKS